MAIDIHEKSLKFCVKFYSPFYSFLRYNENDEVLILHECGVLKINLDGDIIWQYESDIIT